MAPSAVQLFQTYGSSFDSNSKYANRYGKKQFIKEYGSLGLFELLSDIL